MSPIFSVGKKIIDGYLSVPVNTQYTWRYEIAVSNIGKGRICNVVMANIINLNSIDEVNLIFISKGNALFVDSNIIWSIGSLRVGETVIMQVQVTGSFNTEGNYHLGKVNVMGLDPILDTILGEPVTGFDIAILPA